MKKTRLLSFLIIVLLVLIVIVYIVRELTNRESSHADQRKPHSVSYQANSRAIIDQTYAFANDFEGKQDDNSFYDSTLTSDYSALSKEELYHLATAYLPASLQGTEIDGGFRLDENGRLIVEGQVLHVFEYFMSALGEESLEQIVERVKQLIAAALPNSAQKDAYQLLAQYLDYRDQQGVLQESMGTKITQLAEMRELFNQLKQIRQDVFGVENAQSLFQDEEAYTQFNLDVMELNRAGESQDALEKIQNMKLLASHLPETRRAQVEEQLRYKELDIRTQALIDQGASAQELYDVRAELVGVDAAIKLAELDQTRSLWDERVERFKQDYQSQQNVLPESFSETDRQQHLNQLLDQHGFTDAERKRVKGILELY